MVIQIVQLNNVPEEQLEKFEMTQEQYDLLLTYLEIEVGSLMEISMLIKAFIIMFIILMGWRLVRK